VAAISKAKEKAQAKIITAKKIMKLKINRNKLHKSSP